MRRGPVFIGTATETFTATQSGAIATIMHALGRCAQAEGLSPLVIARRAEEAEALADVDSVLLDYPPVPERGLPLLARRAERKLRGWTRLRQGPWMRSVARVLAKGGLGGRPWVLFNEPELAVFLRRQFPSANILHWFQNQLPCKQPSRQQLVKACDLVLGVSNFTAGWVRDYYRVPEAKLRTLYNAVDAETFRLADVEPPGPPVIQFVGRTGIEKAPDLLLEACLQLAEITTTFRVRLVGSNHWGRFTLDDYQRRLRELARQLEAKGVSVEQTGHVDRQRLPEVMRTAHIHVTPSRWDEPFGLTTLEGMASGLATIASDTGGSAEVVGDAGLLFARDDAADLAEKLKFLTKDADARRRCGAECRRRAESFSWQASWQGLTAAIDATDQCELDSTLSTAHLTPA